MSAHLLLVCAVASGCTRTNSNRFGDFGDASDDLGAGDLAIAANEDLAIADLAELDLSATSDLAGNDLSTAVDLAGVDLSADLAGSDLSMPDLRIIDMASGCAIAPQGPLTTWYSGPSAFAATVPAGTPIELIVPDGHRVHGTVSLGSALPTIGSTDAGVPGIAYLPGEVALIDASSGITYVPRSITPASTSSFTYEMNLPAGSYYISAAVRLRVEDPENPAFFTTLESRGSSGPFVVCGDTTKNQSTASVPALEPKQVRVSGRNGLDPQPAGLTLFADSNGVTYRKSASRFLDSGTFDVFGIENLPLPAAGTNMTAVIRPFTVEKTTVPRAGAYDTRLGIDGTFTVAAGAQAFALAIPLLSTLSGTVSDPFSQLFPASGNVPRLFLHAIHCDRTASEYGIGTLFTDALAYKFFVRRGGACDVAGAFLVGMPSPGMPAVSTRENTDGVLYLPKTTVSESIPITFTRNWSIPNLGTQIQVALVVKDIRGVLLSDRHVRFDSTALTDGNLSDARVRMDVDCDGAASANAHLLPGSYVLEVAKN